MDKDIELKNIELVKLFLMISVVLYHSMAFWKGNWFTVITPEPSALLNNIALWLNTFHIYGFALASGYLFQVLKCEREHYKDFSGFLKKKAQRLLVPLLFISLAWAAPIYAYFFYPSIEVVVEKFILMESPSQLWFLGMLFVVFMLYWPVAKLTDRNILVGGGIAIACFLLGNLGERVFPNVLQIWTGMRFVLYFYLGVCLRKDGKKRAYKIPSVVYLCVHILLFIIWSNINERGGILLKLISFAVSELMYVIGAIGAFVIFERIACRIKKQNSVLKFGCKYSMSIYLFHQQIIYVVLYLLNGKLPPNLLAMTCFIVAIAVSSFLSISMARFKLTRFLVSGSVAEHSTDHSCHS